MQTAMFTNSTYRKKDVSPDPYKVGLFKSVLRNHLERDLAVGYFPV